MTKYLPFLNFLVVGIIPFLLKLENRLTKLETKIECHFAEKKGS